MAHFRFNLHAHHDALTRQNIDKERMKMGKLLIFACFFLYTSSMAAKGIFAAEVKYIIDMWGLTQAKAQMANAFYFVPYGIVQVFLSILMGKLNIRKYLIVTVPAAAVFTALMGVATGIEGIWIFFGLTGAFQAGIYAGCNYTLTTNLPGVLLTKANKIMNMGYAVGSVFAYAVSALCIGFDLWQIPYFLIGLIFAVSVVVFAFITRNAVRFRHVNQMLDKNIRKGSESGKTISGEALLSLKGKKEKIIFYTADLMLTFIITAIYYSVMNFITSTLVDVYNISQDVSIYVAIIAPIAIMFGPLMVISACEKDRDFIKQGVIFTMIALPLPLLLVFFYDANIILYLVLVIVFVVIANGIKAICLSVITFKMKDQINAGAYSALSNAVASVAAGVAPVVLGRIKDVYGWVANYWVCFGMTAFVLIALFVFDLVVVKNNKKG